MKDTQPEALRFSFVDPLLLDIVWEDAVKLLQPAIDTAGGMYTAESVREALDRRLLVLWLATDGTKPIAAITTRIIAYPTARALAMDWIGGSRMKEWLPIAMPEIKKYAAFQGCTRLEGYGRKAWMRWLSPHGWEQNYIAYKMDLTDE